MDDAVKVNAFKGHEAVMLAASDLLSNRLTNSNRLNDLFAQVKSSGRKLTLFEKAYIFACANLFLNCKCLKE
ncbi:hypothetical protein HDU98_002612, partial [Podochytrium sp. JEL0797]